LDRNAVLKIADVNRTDGKAALQ